MSNSRISRVAVTPVAFEDPPLLNVVGVHQPYALRAIVELHTDSGLLGLGETYADEAHLLRVNIHNLRRKIEPDPSRPTYIVTEPGVGYRLRTEIAM